MSTPTKPISCSRWSPWVLLFAWLGAESAVGQTNATKPASASADAPTTAVAFDRKEDVVYGRKHGIALTLDVFTPTSGAKGKGVILVVSGGWFSAHAAISKAMIQPMLNHGYTVFAVVHGSQPKFTIPEILEDMNRSVRFIRSRAKEYGIAPDKIGIYGGSAGGHLSLMQGTAGDEGKKDSTDPVDRESSRVQAVACFFPPTDFLNYGKPGENALGRGILDGFRAPFDFKELDTKKNQYVAVTDESKVIEIGKAISPVNHVTPDDPPTLIYHGDADKLVPLQQAELIVKKLEDSKVPVKLVVKPGAGHGWADILKDVDKFADWFDQYLK